MSYNCKHRDWCMNGHTMTPIVVGASRSREELVPCQVPAGRPWNPGNTTLLCPGDMQCRRRANMSIGGCFFFFVLNRSRRDISAAFSWLVSVSLLLFLSATSGSSCRNVKSGLVDMMSLVMDQILSTLPARNYCLKYLRLLLMLLLASLDWLSQVLVRSNTQTPPALPAPFEAPCLLSTFPLRLSVQLRHLRGLVVPLKRR